MALILPAIKAPTIPQTASKVSQSPNPTPIDNRLYLGEQRAQQGIFERILRVFESKRRVS